MIVSSNKKYLFRTSIGNAIEYYDIMLFGFFAIIIGPLFFPFENKMLTNIAGFGAFAASYVMRPLGGIFFGHLGDKVGRHNALKISIFIIIFPTFLVSLLPTYELIGILSPILLVIFRMLQGFCLGGEYSGASVYISENTEKEFRGFYGSILCASGSTGALFGILLGVIFTLKFFPDWCWRIPFFIGGVLSVFAYILRTELQETKVFQKFKKASHQKRNPTLEVIKENPRNFIAAVCISGASFVPFYLASIFANSIFVDKLGLDSSFVLPINVLLLTIQTIMVLVMGYLSDKIGKKQLMMIASSALVVFAVPIFNLIGKGGSLPEVLFGQIILCLIGPGLVSPIAGFFPELFPTKSRYSGVALGTTIGGAVFGGTTPLIAAFMTEFLNDPIAPAYYLAFCSFLSFIALSLIRQKGLKLESLEVAHA